MPEEAQRYREQGDERIAKFFEFPGTEGHSPAIAEEVWYGMYSVLSPTSNLCLSGLQGGHSVLGLCAGPSAMQETPAIRKVEGPESVRLCMFYYLQSHTSSLVRYHSYLCKDQQALELQAALAAVHKVGNAATWRPTCCGVMAATVLSIFRPAPRAAARGTAAFLEKVTAHAPQAGTSHHPPRLYTDALPCTYSQMLALPFSHHVVSCLQMFKALQGTQAPRIGVQGCCKASCKTFHCAFSTAGLHLFVLFAAHTDGHNPLWQFVDYPGAP